MFVVRMLHLGMVYEQYCVKNVDNKIDWKYLNEPWLQRYSVVLHVLWIPIFELYVIVRKALSKLLPQHRCRPIVTQ